MMKAILSLQHATVPKNLHFTALPEEMTKIETNLFVPEEATPWPTNGHHPRRAAVSSYGFSGTNVHAVLEQAPVDQSVDDRRQRGTDADRRRAVSAVRDVGRGAAPHRGPPGRLGRGSRRRR